MKRSGVDVPRVSVIIPAYNGARYLPATLRSVLGQTLEDFEIIVVDDGSSDDTAAVAGQVRDRRLKLLSHGRNLGLCAARNTGIRAARGTVLAFLDQDDLFHPDKLQAHVDLMQARPDVGFTYNARFDLHYSSEQIRGLWRPPRVLSLADVLLGFPVAPSDMVTTKHWASAVGMWDEDFRFFGGEYVFLGRLWLAGCKFACVDRALNYRRYHSGRVYRDVAANCAWELNGQEKVFADPRLPDSVRSLRPRAFANTHLVWAYHVLAQGETALGQRLLRQAIRLDPSTVEARGRRLLELLIGHSIADENVDHEERLHRIWSQLPPELAWLGEAYPWAVASGWLWRGTRAVMWGGAGAGREHFARAAVHHARIDEPAVQRLTYELLNYETEFGAAAADTVRAALVPFIAQIGGRTAVRRLNGCYAINRAFASYHERRYGQVPARVARAIANDPRYVLNRGVLAMLFRSITGTGRTQHPEHHIAATAA